MIVWRRPQGRRASRRKRPPGASKAGAASETEHHAISERHEGHARGAHVRCISGPRIILADGTETLYKVGHVPADGLAPSRRVIELKQRGHPKSQRTLAPLPV